MLWYSAAMTILANSLGHPWLVLHHTITLQQMARQLGLQPPDWMSMANNRLGWMSTPMPLPAALFCFKNNHIAPEQTCRGASQNDPISNSWEGTLMFWKCAHMVTCAICLNMCWAICRIVSTRGPHHALHIVCVIMQMMGH